MNTNTPYANLDPNLVLEAVEQLGFQCTGSLLPLNSYENRVFQIGIEEAPPIIAKFYRPARWSDAAILEEHQFAQELVEQEIPVIAPWHKTNQQTLHEHAGFRFALFPCKGGRPLELDRLEQLEWMGRFIGRVHAVGASQPFLHRPRLDIKTHGHEPYQYLLANHFIPEHLKINYCQTVDTLLQKIEEKFQQVGELEYLRIHGDIHAGNVLWRDEGPHIVDLDDCVMGPAIQDLWMLLSGNHSQMQTQLECILAGYREFHYFNFRELHLIEALRSLRMLQYSAWIASRWHDPAFPASFPWFNTPTYWQQQWQDLREQIELLETSTDYSLSR